MTISTLPPLFAPSGPVARIAAASRRVQQPQSSAGLVSLAMSEPNFDTPVQIAEAATAALRAGRTHYSPLLGEAGLREAIAERLTRTAVVPASPGDVLITHGGTGGLAASLLSIIDPGDRVVIPDPTYSLYADLISMAGGIADLVPLTDDLHWDFDRLADALPGAKLFVFCNPGNPTGIVHTRTDLETLAQLLAATLTVVVSDEAYADLTYTAAPFTSAIEIDELRERTVLPELLQELRHDRLARRLPVGPRVAHHERAGQDAPRSGHLVFFDGLQLPVREQFVAVCEVWFVCGRHRCVIPGCAEAGRWS
jgi:aspartate aminotransferase